MQNKRHKLTKYLLKDTQTEEVVRSHAFSRVARTNRPVPTRRTAAPGQQAVGGYRESLVGSIAQYRDRLPVLPTTPAVEEPVSTDENIIGNRPKSGTTDRGETGKNSVDRRHHFIEPPKRNFNRFS